MPRYFTLAENLVQIQGLLSGHGATASLWGDIFDLTLHMPGVQVSKPHLEGETRRMRSFSSEPAILITIVGFWG